MALTDTFIKDRMKELLPINSSIYSNKLDNYIKGAKSKLKREGVDNIFNETEDIAFDYCICIAYQIAKDMDFDIDFMRSETQYLTRVNGLRTYLLTRIDSN